MTLFLAPSFDVEKTTKHCKEIENAIALKLFGTKLEEMTDVPADLVKLLLEEAELKAKLGSIEEPDKGTF